MVFLRSLDNECKAMPFAASRLPRSRFLQPRAREPSQPALSHKFIKNLTKDLEVRWDLGNRASPVNRALACSRRSDSSRSRAREKNSRRKKERGETRGGKGKRVLTLSLSPVYNLTRSPVTAALHLNGNKLTGLMWRGQSIQKNTRPQLFKRCIHRINHYPLDSAVGFPNTYPLDTAVYPQGHPLATSIFGK